MMNGNVESIERYLQGVAVPRYVSEAHRRQLRRRVLSVVNKRRLALPVRGMSWKIAAAILVCTAGVLGMFVEARHHGAGSNSGGLYQLISRNSRVPTPAVPDANNARPAAPTENDLEVLNLLQQQGNIKFVSVIESEVNGRPDSRTLLYQYALSEERMNTRVERDPNQADTDPLASLPAAARTEISLLRQTGRGENLGTQVQQVKGRPFVFTRERFTLHNGTKVLVSVGAPQEAKSSPK